MDGLALALADEPQRVALPTEQQIGERIARNLKENFVLRQLLRVVKNTDPNFATRSIEELDLGTRAFNVLWEHGILTVGDLILLSANQLETLRGLGATSLNQIRTQLQAHGLELAEPTQEEQHHGLATRLGAATTTTTACTYSRCGCNQ
jgi:DNA-directed RNA polymerase alpha subunit